MQDAKFYLANDDDHRGNQCLGKLQLRLGPKGHIVDIEQGPHEPLGDNAIRLVLLDGSEAMQRICRNCGCVYVEPTD